MCERESNKEGRFWLDSLRALVKGDLTFFQREVLCALIVVEVHARDVTNSLLVEGVKNVTDFQWMCQLRYYEVVRPMDPLEEDEPAEIYQDEERLDTRNYYRQFSLNSCDVKALNSVFPYSNDGRLVITPLTDRCYLTLMCAMHLKFGGAPAGPAGTGKTETTKALFRPISMMVPDYTLIAEISLVSFGFLEAKDHYDFGMRAVKTVITVAGNLIRQMPDGDERQIVLRSLRDVNVPKFLADDLLLFNDAGRRREADSAALVARRERAQMTSCSYNGAYFITVINLIRQMPDGDEKQIVLRSLRDVNVPKFLADDLLLFNGAYFITVINLIRQMPDGDERQIVLRSLRDVNVPKFLADELFNAFIYKIIQLYETTVVRHGLMLVGPAGAGKTKIIQLYETTVVRHGLMLVGPAGAGKTKIIQLYETTVVRHGLMLVGPVGAGKTKLAPDGFPFSTVLTFVVNPKSITMGQLYGEFDVLDDNKKLCLSSGEIMKLTDRQRMIFEVADLAVASPATVSRCGMVYLDSKIVGLQPLVNAWLKANVPPVSTSWHRLTKLVGCWVVWAVIWSVGATCDHNGRAIFSDFM
ncbi:putative dynein, axonemal, heavy polypeptide 1 [Operophtera brumata]|uniref:Putative dynein, axonemal, heavy polypeptide 1 n=1 Tax=Operophtera brumata TaxID=104452 RepID=A0A0L7L548_OPEBR|nr:putative dynein, axonemal, heavy polypeptide 1 [Operophtera brumata]